MKKVATYIFKAALIAASLALAIHWGYLGILIFAGVVTWVICPEDSEK